MLGRMLQAPALCTHQPLQLQLLLPLSTLIVRKLQPGDLLLQLHLRPLRVLHCCRAGCKLDLQGPCMQRSRCGFLALHVCQLLEPLSLL